VIGWANFRVSQPLDVQHAGRGNLHPYLLVAGHFVESGGMDRANLELARYLLTRGHEVHLVAHRVSSNLAKHPAAVVHYAPRPLGSNLLGEPVLDSVGRFVARRLPSATRIVVNGGNCSLAGANWVHFVHGRPSSALTWSARGAVTRAWARGSEMRALRRAKLVIANSERTKSDLQEYLGIEPSTIQTIYCGVDASQFFPVDAEARRARAEALGFDAGLQRAVFVGALGDSRKGFDLLFEAWLKLARKWRDFELIVVGSGRMLPMWVKRAEAVEGTNRVRFMRAREDVPAILQSSDVLVAPSRYEPYGLNIAEAVSSGLAVIATETAGACERISGSLREILITAPPSARDLVAKLEVWAEDPDKYRAAAVAASTAMRAYDWNAMSAKIYEMVEHAYA
jgi:glycosyltransferase involved in cell wall biosynthesis